MTAPTFKDHFSLQSQDYAAHRPGYPAELYAWVANFAAAHDRAWDCATGNGQAAIDLARRFEHVVATDASAAQIRNRRTHERIDYVVALAESAPLANRCCDLVTVAQAVHWFDFERFYAEVRRVLKPAGVVAVWSYATFTVTPEVDAEVGEFYEHVVGRYWPPERYYVEQAYRTLPFPFAETAAPEFHYECRWTLDQVMGYFASWSAVQRFKQAQGHDPLPALRTKLERVWGSSDAVRPVTWPIHVRAGCV